MRILLVEDDPLIGEAIRKTLTDSAYSIDWVQDGETGLAAARAQEYNLMLLDLGLPKKGGFEVLKELRDEHNVMPIIITTAQE